MTPTPQEMCCEACLGSTYWNYDGNCLHSCHTTPPDTTEGSWIEELAIRMECLDEEGFPGDIRKERRRIIGEALSFQREALREKIKGMGKKDLPRESFLPSEGISVAHQDHLIENQSYNQALSDVLQAIKEK